MSEPHRDSCGTRTGGWCNCGVRVGTLDFEDAARLLAFEKHMRRGRWLWDVPWGVRGARRVLRELDPQPRVSGRAWSRRRTAALLRRYPV